jgi:hypothetical protein
MTVSAPSRTLGTLGRVLTFRARRAELVSLDAGHLTLGLVCTWLVGMGRYWDDPRAGLLQRLGAGSVVYVFALALLLWLALWPLRPESWSYFRVLTYITLVAPPAALYALPVERWMSIQAARSTNFWFLAVVALWRVALLLYFVTVLGNLAWWRALVGSLLPLALIVAALALLNLDHVVLDFMAGNHNSTDIHSDAYLALVGITFLAFTASPVLLLSYIALIVETHLRRRRARNLLWGGLGNPSDPHL